MHADTDYRWIELSRDYRGRLEQFECAKPYDTPIGLHAPYVRKHGKYYFEYEWEVQSTIRSMRTWDRQKQWVELCVSKSTDGNRLERLYAFVWFGVIGGRKIDANGTYMIGYIARENCLDGCRFGDRALNHALAIINENHVKTGREHVVAARIDPQNKASGELFRRHGFEDYGVDPEATDYHRWLKFCP